MLHVFSEEAQNDILSAYNKSKNKTDKIPLVARNYDTGWPLLQVGFYTASENTKNITTYEPVTGGEKCHYVEYPALFFAILLNQIPGKVTITTYSRGAVGCLERTAFNVDDISKFLNEWTFRHEGVGISVSQESTAWGKRVVIETADISLDESLGSALITASEFSLKEGKTLRKINEWGDGSDGYTQGEFQDVLNPEVAIFSNGQVFVDLGMLFEYTQDKEEMIKMFKNLFKVDEFLELKNTNPAFKPLPIKPETDTPVVTLNRCNQTLFSTPDKPEDSNENKPAGGARFTMR